MLLAFVAVCSFTIAYFERQKQLQSLQEVLIQSFLVSYPEAKLVRRFGHNRRTLLPIRYRFDPVIEVFITQDSGLLDDELVEFLSEFRFLKTLDFCSNDDREYLDTDLSKLASLEDLTLSIRPNSHCVNSLKKCRNLKSLTLRGVGLRDSDVSALAELNLHKLYLSGNPLITDDSLNSISHLKELRVLELSEANITRRGISRLFNLDLTALYVDGIPITDDSVKEICNHFPKLRILWLGKTKITEKSFDFLNAHPSIEEINVSWNALSPDALLKLNAKKIVRVLHAG